MPHSEQCEEASSSPELYSIPQQVEPPCILPDKVHCFSEWGNVLWLLHVHVHACIYSMRHKKGYTPLATVVPTGSNVMTASAVIATHECHDEVVACYHSSDGCVTFFVVHTSLVPRPSPSSVRAHCKGI